jgi:uncharacterized protein
MPRRSSPSAKVLFPARSREALVEELRAGLQRLGRVLPLRRAVLFGSRATGRHTATSDIDLLIIYADPPHEHAFVLAKKHIGVRQLEPHVYSESEAQSIRETITRMTADGIEIPLAPE